jgi:hypothetical protein
MRLKPALLTCIALLLLGPSGTLLAAQAKARAAITRPDPADKSGLLRSTTHRKTLKQLSGQASLTLRGTEGSVVVPFGSRQDEIVVGASLRLRYSYSPAVVVSQSHIKVFLNEEFVGTVPFATRDAGRSTTHTIEIDPRLVSPHNHLKFQFIGHYEAECPDQLHSGLWAEVSGLSELELTVRPLPIVSDLALLPAPFFDRHDLTRLVLPFVFPARPDNETLRAAAVVASWFGQLAGWRGARFPVHFDAPPKGHAVVFGTNGARPAFLADSRPADGARLTVIDNPADGHSKLLLVLGRDPRDLKLAADALVLGNAVLSGPTAVVQEVHARPMRQPYDAPNWVRSDRPTRLGELVRSPDELQVVGHSPDLIRITLRIPPDLFLWRSRGVAVELKYRHNAPDPRTASSRLTVSINDQLLRSYELGPSDAGHRAIRARVPLVDASAIGESGNALVPAFALGPHNELEFGFAFGVPRDGRCRDTFVPGIRGAIDPDSTVDLSGYPHYAAMPNLGLFASTGFPFTKYADLSQTVVVMPREPTTHDVEVLLTLLGRMGESTGHPATHVRVAGPDAERELVDADLLVIGSLPHQAQLAKWHDRLPAVVDGAKRRLDLPARQTRLAYDWFGLGTAADPGVLATAVLDDSGPLAALLGFESPFSAKRSVVAVTASAPEHFGLVLDTLQDTGRVRAMRGSTVLVHANKVESFLVGRTYFVGDLPFSTTVWYHLSRYPLLLAIAIVVLALGIAFFLRFALQSISTRRMRSDS